MKKYFLIAALLVMGSYQVSAQTANQKMGYVDSQVILTQLPEAIKAQGDLDALTNRWSAQLDSMRQAYQTAIQDYQKQMNTMPADKKQAAEQKIVAQEQQMREFQQQKFGQGTGEIYKRNEEIFGPLKEKIYKAIEDVAKKEGVNFVFDKSGDIVLLYADTQFDLTYQVLDKLKRGN